MTDPKQFSVFICGCARDVEKQLPGVLANFESIGSLFGSARYAVVENDSKDGTRMSLIEWERGDMKRRKYINLLGLDARLKTRTERLPECRNALVEELWRGESDIMVMMDMDGICEDPIPSESILSCFAHPMDGWAVMTANVSVGYYDIWALRSEWCPYDCWKKAGEMRDVMSYGEAIDQFINIHKKNIPRNAPPIEVESAFGGLGVYQTRFLKGCWHSMVSTYGVNDIEHCAFNQAIRRNGGKIFINPAMIIR